MKCAQKIIECLFILYNNFSLAESINLCSMLLSERFRRAEESVVRQMRDFYACCIECDDIDTRVHNNLQSNNAKSFFTESEGVLDRSVRPYSPALFSYAPHKVSI